MPGRLWGRRQQRKIDVGRFKPSLSVINITALFFIVGTKAATSTLYNLRAASAACLHVRTPISATLPASTPPLARRRIRPVTTLPMSTSEESGNGAAPTPAAEAPTMTSSARTTGTNGAEGEPVANAAAASPAKDVVRVVNLLELASAAVACTVTASRKITALSSLYKDKKNARLKGDGSFVTDADFLAQGAIVEAIQKVSKHVRIVGEESAEEMAAHVDKFGAEVDVDVDVDVGDEAEEEAEDEGDEGENSTADNGDKRGTNSPAAGRGRKRRLQTKQQQQRRQEIVDQDILERTRAEVRYRLRLQSKSSLESAPPIPESLPLSPATTTTTTTTTTDAAASSSSLFSFSAKDESDPDDCLVDARRVSVIVDPLDGTKSYAQGDYDAVSILVGIVVDNAPVFGVIGKPFGYTGLTPILDTGCVTIYGGPLLKGVYVAGRHEPVVPIPLATAAADSAADILQDLPKAVISSSRSQGVVQDFCVHLGSRGLIDPAPLHISGAGEKSLRLILQRNNEALWFFPKGGTSRWDVAAPDALLRSLGGRLSDKFGNDLDYGASRENAENVDGIVACIDAALHAECIRLFREGDWAERN